MNYDNNLNPNDTISSLDKGMASGGGVGKQENPRQLRRRFTAAMVALLLTFLAVSSATYAWYIYNTSRHTTNVRMAAGAGVNLQISNSYSGTYGSAAVLDSFAGQLVPVSTNRISGGFQKVLGFTEGSSQSGLVASIFGSGEQTDYYQTSLFLRTNGTSTDIYLSDIGFEDSDEKNPISSAIRVGLVVHQAGQNQSVDGNIFLQSVIRRILRQIITLPLAVKAMCWTVPGQTAAQWRFRRIRRMPTVSITRTLER